MGVRNIFLGIAKDGLDQALLVGKFLCCLNVFNSYFCTMVISYGPSMLPTLGTSNSLLVAERISTRFNKISKGDIVIVRSPEVPRKIVTKRIAGIEGDRVTYIVDPTTDANKVETVMVPKGHVWIEGDNIYYSNDSRKFGAVPYSLVLGRVFWRIWPPKEFGSLD